MEAEHCGMPTEVTERLRWFKTYALTDDVSETCRKHGIARSTFYRWYRRFDAEDLSTLTDTPTTQWCAKSSEDVHSSSNQTSPEQSDRLREPLAFALFCVSIFFGLYSLTNIHTDVSANITATDGRIEQTEEQMSDLASTIERFGNINDCEIAFDGFDDESPLITCQLSLNDE